ncbi:LacI family DNA-binding transcriptional regulator [Nonomuraea zeae]|uniref:Substrate-binding domain-containing protein n=1 Tax=Nonomuraea zeae TaxID=1642303 RepID=A0A5S4GMU0_9ACTN|nr:LacI family DNA-binding transcriptional regulator [Nonomuraea zeae]TMR34256.1 substrate-binding domain-containing protein [Nonomuraea zeae]
MSSRRSRTTLASVAASAGVSVATVSKVLNDHPQVAPGTRSLVQSMLREHGYVPRASRRESAKAAPAVEIWANEWCTYSTEIIAGAIAAGAESDVAAVVTTIEHAATGDASWARDLAAAGRRAVITLADGPSPSQLAALSRARLPVVVVDPLNPPRPPAASVGATNFAGGLSATRHLLELGHQRIAYLGGPATTATNQARMHGYRAAMEAADLPVPTEYVRTADFCYPHGVKAGAALLDLRPAPTAIFAACDYIALGAIETARARGLRIPEDLSVVGFDDTQLAAMTSPQLTTVRQPLRAMGALALRIALRLAGGEEIASHHMELATELVIRDSTQAA